MDKTTWGLIAAIGAASAIPTAAQSSAPAVDAILKPTSVAALLDPVAAPVATLDALQDRKLEAVEVADATVIVHHHHHHHRVVVIHRHHHHHHHHHVVIVHHD